MSQAPAGPPPGGDQNQGPTVEIVCWLFTALALITVFLRLLVRLRITHNPGWDDFWIVLAMLFNLTYTILIVVAVDAGNGRHIYYLQPQQISDAIRWNSIAFIPGIMAFSIPKLGVAILLMRLLNPSKLQRCLMYFFSIGCIIGSILCAIILWQQCNPPSILWDPAAVGTCWQPSVAVNFFTFVGAFSACTDIYLALYPTIVLYKLNISMNKKIGLSAVLSLGFVAAILAIYKCTRLQGLYNHSDYTYSTVDLLIWTSIESSFIIIAADLPTLRPVFQIIMGRSATGQGRSEGLRQSSYKLNSVSKVSRNGKRGPKEQYPLDTVDLVRQESVERILPPNRIRKTFDVNVSSVSHQDAQLETGRTGASVYNLERYDV
ncbi:hypothetical protein MMC18_002657 [Xylographa bjoerkii]|nr:hypothetical protein [Xylographa bjoerkii]